MTLFPQLECGMCEGYIGGFTCIKALGPFVFSHIVALQMMLQLNGYPIAVCNAHPIAEVVFNGGELFVAAIGAALL